MPFSLKSDYNPSSSQKKAIKELTDGINQSLLRQTLLGVTGSGKTFTIANVIAEIQQPTLIISHNKTLAAQLFGEFKSLFPKNAVEYFISYYDYYQPEAYIPSTDKFIDKDFRINDEIDRLRLRATSSLLSGRKDVIVVSSVSCIYGIASPQEWSAQTAIFKKNDSWSRKALLEELIKIHYVRTSEELSRGRFRVKGDIIDIIPAYETHGIRIEMLGNIIERIVFFDVEKDSIIEETPSVVLYPAKQFVTSESNLKLAIKSIKKELLWQLDTFRKEGKYAEAQRLEERTKYDIEMMRELGYCSGIENYSRHLGNRKEGERAPCLLDYFPKDNFLVVIDESHVTIPQIRAMYEGDRSRKITLVNHGFRLPSALDNRPLKFKEFETLLPSTLFISATPSSYELDLSGGAVVELIIRPTGLLDPKPYIRPVKNQIDNLIMEIRKRSTKGEKILAVTLTKRMAEDLQEYLEKLHIRAQYLHSDIKSIDRIKILRGLRTNAFDVLVGVNILREGLDLPEVSLVAILDADKEGFLRDAKSLFQIAGRAARHVDGIVILYADNITRSIKTFLEETKRRRSLQQEYNKQHNITPSSIIKTSDQVRLSTAIADISQDKKLQPKHGEIDEKDILAKIINSLSLEEKTEMIKELEQEMLIASNKMDYEKAASIRDDIETLKEELNP